MSAKLSYSELSYALEPVYTLLSSHPNDEPWKWPVCELWSRVALPIARAALQSESVMHIVRVPNRTAKLHYDIPFTFHHFLADMDSDDPLIIDGTYQQFAHSIVPAEAPHVLVAPASSTPALLAKANIKADHHDQWRVDIYGSDIFTSYEH